MFLEWSRTAAESGQWLFFVLLTIQFVIVVNFNQVRTTAQSAASNQSGCQKSDHQECDEICKQDSFWYGECRSWTGREFSCECFEYREPLDKTLCTERQRECVNHCKKQGLEGGYCYVHTMPEAERGVADCKCLEAVPIIK